MLARELATVRPVPDSGTEYTGLEREELIPAGRLWIDACRQAATCGFNSAVRYFGVRPYRSSRMNHIYPDRGYSILR